VFVIESIVVYVKGFVKFMTLDDWIWLHTKRVKDYNPLSE